MKTYKKLIILSLFLIALASIAMAAEKNSDTGAANEKNMTYGKCVSGNAALKNTCYKASKETLSQCKTSAAGGKEAEKTCKKDYAKEKKQCKAGFKSAKNECKKIKHNFFETMGSSMK